MWPIWLLLVAAISVIHVQSTNNYNNVTIPMKFKKSPLKRTSTVDQRNVTITCRVIGNPKPKVWWIRNGTKLTNERYQMLDTGDLFIRDVELSDGSRYRCNAQDVQGSIKTASGELIVKEHTKIIDKPEDYEAEVGTPVTFRCSVVADKTLNLTVEWQIDNKTIDFKSDPRFVLTNDYSLNISKTAKQDAGVYTCLARTDLDNVTADATLTVGDIGTPKAPTLISTNCSETNATINWKPNGDNHSPILFYLIEHNTSFAPDNWEILDMDVPATNFTYNFTMSPWVNYTFRVIAFNKVGPSLPSKHNKVCTSQPSVPFENPDNVKGQGTEPNNLVIRWTPMSEIKHNGPRFQYQVYWQLATEVDHWNTKDIFDWRQSELLIHDQETFRRYRFKVVAINELGEAKVAPKIMIGYSGEDKPLEAPTNFTLIQVTNATSAILSWNPVSEDSVQGHFKGYKIQIWTEADGEENLRQVLVSAKSKQALVTNFAPYSTNHVRILVYNRRFNGPPSTTLSFDTPEGVPNAIQSLDAIPLGESALLLKWKRPLQTHGNLTGYKIYYQEVNTTTGAKGTIIGPRMEREPRINDHRVTEAKLGKLKSATTYRIHVVGTTKAGEGADFHIDRMTDSNMPIEPDRPHFSYELQPKSEHDDDQVDVKIVWRPVLEGTPGLLFFVKFRLKGATKWFVTDPEQYEIHHTVHDLEPNSIYEFRVVSVEWKYQTESFTQEIYTSANSIPNRVLQTVATVAMVVVTSLILIIVCIIRRNRANNKRRVVDQEISYVRNAFAEEIGFSKGWGSQSSFLA